MVIALNSNLEREILAIRLNQLCVLIECESGQLNISKVEKFWQSHFMNY